jgi:hypothetical protein
MITMHKEDMIPYAIDAGDIHSFEKWLENYDYDLEDLLNSHAKMTCGELLDYLKNGKYKEYALDQLDYLLDVVSDDYWYDDVEIEVEVKAVS